MSNKRDRQGGHKGGKSRSSRIGRRSYKTRTAPEIHHRQRTPIESKSSRVEKKEWVRTYRAAKSSKPGNRLEPEPPVPDDAVRFISGAAAAVVALPSCSAIARSPRRKKQADRRKNKDKPGTDAQRLCDDTSAV